VASLVDNYYRPLLCRSVFAFVLLAVLVSGQAAAEQQARPNVLVLMAEDMGPRVRAFGDEVAVTPNLDHLARQGVRYTNVFATAGVCAPSRAAHITGMHQVSFGAQHMRTYRGPLGSYKTVPPPEVKAYPELLRRAGYYTWTDDKLDYQFSHIHPGSGPFTIWDDEGEEGHWRNRQAGQPFYGLVNLQLTHEGGVFTPLGTWPNSVLHLYTQIDRWRSLPGVEDETPVSPEQVQVPPYYPDTLTVRADIARHYNNIAAMDKQVGDILRALEEDGLADSTIVIWVTDHGDGLPRAKRELFDSGTRVPMIVRWPDTFRPKEVAVNSIDGRLVSLIDLAPTILRLAGVEPPSYLQGVDFIVGPPRRFVFSARDRIDKVHDRQRAVTDGRYKYIRSWYPDQAGGHDLAYRDNLSMMKELKDLYSKGQLNDVQRQWFEPPGLERLYDLDTDPHETTNLVQDPRYQSQLEVMREAMIEWQSRVRDLGEISERQMLSEFWPGNTAPLTAAPEIRFANGFLHLHSSTVGASVGLRINDGRWQLYSQPVPVMPGARVEAKAVRYGWEESTLASAVLDAG